MIKDITIGQYFPGDTFIHRLDPRIKIIIIALFIVTLFFINNFILYTGFRIYIDSSASVKGPLKFILRV